MIDERAGQSGPGGLRYRVREARVEPSGALVLLHGRGTDELDLLPLIDALPGAIGVPWERTVLGGFSQGTAMSYALGLGPGRPSPAGIIALSGFIPSVPDWNVDLEGRRGLPVAIGHGTFDPVIPVQFARQARSRLEAAGLAVTYKETPTAHSIHPALLDELRDWLASTAASIAPP